jgi:uncharacterized damage-inducible protein DinB
MKPKSLTTLALLFLALTGAAQAQIQATQPDPAAPFKNFYNSTKQYVIGAAEKMPAEHFSYKPTSDVRSYAEILGHIIDTNYWACAALRGEANPNKEDLEKTLKTKDEVVKAVKSSFEYCDGAMKTLSEATLTETFKSGARDVPKTSPLLLLIAHSQEHYGNLVTYLRLKGLLPPSSEPPPAKK